MNILLQRFKLAWGEIPLAWDCAFKYGYNQFEFMSLIFHILMFIPTLPFYLVGFLDRNLEHSDDGGKT